MAVRFVSYKPVFDLESDDNYLQYVSLHDPKTYQQLTTSNKVQRHASPNTVVQLGNGGLGYTYLGNGVILLGSGSLGYSSQMTNRIHNQ